MKKIILFLLSMSLLITHCYAQGDSTSAIQRRKTSFFNDTIWSRGKSVIGYYSEAAGVTSSFSELNSIITNLGYPALTNDYGEASFGFSKRNSHRTSYMSTKISFIVSESSRRGNTDPKDVKLRGWSVLWTVNPNIVRHPKWLVYPYFGIGVGFSSLTLFDNLNYQSFAASAANINTPVTKTWSSFSIKYELGVGFERKIRFWAFDFYTGFSGGYSFRDAAYFTDSYGSHKNKAPIGLDGWTLSWRLRFEIWR
jgi:hypothetical protein